MKKKVIIITLVILLIFLGYKVRQDMKYPFSQNSNELQVVVNEGDSLLNVVSKMKDKNLIKNEFSLKMYIKGSKFNTNIKPGEYSIDSTMATEQFISMLNVGTKDENFVQVTIPEGYDIESIANVLEEKEIINKEDFLKSCKEYTLPNYIKADAKVRYALEGYLFPDTYKFKKNSDGDEVIAKLLKKFEDVIKDIEKDGNKINNLSEAVTIASLIEKEARVDEDRPKISSVIENRINKGMKLQIDAAVIYALGEHKNKLSLNDLKVESPYNIYKVEGLTPGPICSPGRESIEAALNPEDTEYVFYVLEDDKKHYFTKDYNDFLKAKERYKNRTN